MDIKKLEPASFVVGCLSGVLVGGTLVGIVSLIDTIDCRRTPMYTGENDYGAVLMAKNSGEIWCVFEGVAMSLTRPIDKIDASIRPLVPAGIKNRKCVPNLGGGASQ